MTAEAIGSRVGMTDGGPVVPAARTGATPWQEPVDLVHRAHEVLEHTAHDAARTGRLITSLAPPLAAILAAALVAVAVGAGPAVALTVLVVWLVHYVAVLRPDVLSAGPSTAELLRRSGWPFAVVSLGVAAGWLPAAGLGPALVTAVVATAALGVTSAVVRRHGRRPRVLVVGEAPAAQELLRQWHPRADVVPLGRYPLDARLPEAARRAAADAVVLVGPGEDADAVRRLGWALEGTGIALTLAPALVGAAPHRLSVGNLGGRALIEVAPSRARGVVRLVKAALDRVAAVVLLCLTGVPLLLVMLLVRLDSPGNPVFTQVRVGQHGRRFTLYKIRTMCDDAERRKTRLAGRDEGNGVLFKMHDDPRITRVGRLLRRTSVDELPQLLNVLRGEMSLVGPRPALPEEVGEYGEVARRRLAVRPGITGLWQVSGRSDLDWETSVALDVAYTDNVTLGEDLRICARTVGAVVHGHGAY